MGEIRTTLSPLTKSISDFRLTVCDDMLSVDEIDDSKEEMMMDIHTLISSSLVSSSSTT